MPSERNWDNRGVASKVLGGKARRAEHPRSASAPLRCGRDTGGTTREQLPGIVSLLLSLPSTAGNALRVLKINSFSFPTISQQRSPFLGASAHPGARGPRDAPTPSADAWLWHSRLLAIPSKAFRWEKPHFPSFPRLELSR